MSPEPHDPSPDTRPDDVPPDADADSAPDDGAPGHGHDAIVRRHVAAPPERVWEVITDPDLRRRFLGGDLDVELVPGHDGHFDGPGGPVPARVREVRPGRHLGWDWGDGDDVSRVDLDLVPEGDGTDVTIHERPVPARLVAAAALRTIPTPTGATANELLALAA
ncbi:SRPBCC family protein [Salsipaludibacter albus]|uniref:SRPBCC family protein n=1 Tax=Salsipaludibacter albus TaxID=2849650 RepID=UPI001EE3F2AC|nr:SRPBCC domain-containing protein [Salsipaludibacter albus]MBY5162926.1 SRPBCC domain-containing protein [Salsipaludibacter albus]